MNCPVCTEETTQTLILGKGVHGICDQCKIYWFHDTANEEPEDMRPQIKQWMEYVNNDYSYITKRSK